MAMVGADVEEKAFDIVGMGDGSDGLAIARDLSAVFVAVFATLEINDPRFGRSVDDAVGAQYLALPYKAAFVHATVGRVEESSHLFLSHHVV